MAKPENINNDKKPFFSEKTRRMFRFGSGSLLSLIAVVVLFAVINIALEQLPMSMDVSQNKMYSLSDETINLVENLDTEIEIIALYDRVKGEADGSKATIIRILDQYERYGGNKIDIKYISLDDNPGIITQKVPDKTLAASFTEDDYIIRNTKTGRVQRIAASRMFTMELDYTSFQYNIVSVDTEQVVTSAIKYVMADKIPVIYFSTSYGEDDLDDYKGLTDSLGIYNYDIKSIDLDVTEKIPEDASIIVFMSPKRDLTDRMYNMMYDWLTSNDGGDVIFAFDPIHTGEKLSNFKRLTSELFGLQVNNDIVSDVTGNQLAAAGKDTYIYASSVKEEEGPLKDFDVDTRFYAFDSCSIKVLAPVGEFDAGKLFETRGTESTCTDILTGEKTQGKATLAAYSQRLNSTNRIAVFGSTQLLKDDNINKYANTNTVGTFIYTAFWMEDMFETDVSDIEVKTNTGGVVTVSGATSRWLAAFAIVIYPCLIILLGIVIWLRRRHL